MYRALAMILVIFLGIPEVLATSQREAAQAAFSRANRAFDRKDYEQALAGYRRAQALFPSIKILLNIAITLDVMGRGPEAVPLLERFLEVGTSTSRKARREAQARLASLRKRLARIRVKVSPPGARVFVGQRPVTPAREEGWLYLEPGTHVVSVRKDGFITYVQKVALKRGERRDLEARLHPVKEYAPSERQTPRAVAGRQRKATWAIATLGIGLAGAAGAGALYGVGASRGSEAHDRYTGATTHSGGGTEEEVTGYREDVESARRMLTGGHVLAGAAVVAIGVSIYLFSSRSPAADTGGDQLVSSVEIVPSARGATLSIGGRF